LLEKNAREEYSIIGPWQGVKIHSSTSVYTFRCSGRNDTPKWLWTTAGRTRKRGRDTTRNTRWQRRSRRKQHNAIALFLCVQMCCTRISCGYISRKNYTKTYTPWFFEAYNRVIRTYECIARLSCARKIHLKQS
jgi:hypothetical protein